MERFKIKCAIAGKHVELQFDRKKMPGKAGPCYMVTIDGLFKGYITKEKGGTFGPLMNTHFDEEEMVAINDQLRQSIN